MGTFSAIRSPRGTKEKEKPKAPQGPLFLYFTDVTEADLERLAAAGSKADVRRLLKECMKIDEAEGFRMEILADMHYHNYTFCIAQDFVPKKISTFLSIMKYVLEDALNERRPAESAFEVCKKMILKHGVERPPWSVGIFSFDDVKAIMEYAHDSFFRHYNLYTYAFTNQCNLSFSVDNYGLGSAVAQPTLLPQALTLEQEVNPREQSELAHLFEPTEAELAEAKKRELLEQKEAAEDKATKIKRKVDQGVQRLLETFEQKLKDQDDRFNTLLDGA